MLFELFMVGTFWFWALLAVVTVLMFICTEFEKGGWATISVLGTLALLNFCGDVPVLSYIWNHPITILLGVLGYFALGTGWAVVKWWFYVKDQLWHYNELKGEFIKENKLEIKVNQAIVGVEMQNKWADYLRWHDRSIDIHPQINKHKMAVYIWIAYFPFSLIWTLINDPVRKICRRIYHAIADTLQAMSDSIWSGTKGDFEEKK